MGGLVWWLIVGIAGMLAGLVMKGRGYGVVVDVILGILGALSGAGFSACLASGLAAAWLVQSSLRL